MDRTRRELERDIEDVELEIKYFVDLLVVLEDRPVVDTSLITRIDESKLRLVREKKNLESELATTTPLAGLKIKSE